MKNVTAEKERAKADIFESICRQHRVTVDELRGRERTDALVCARVDCVERLRIAGFGLKNIAKIINRDRSTVQYYVSRTRRMTWDRRKRLPQAVYHLPKGLRDVLIDVAEKENVTAFTVMLEWLSERAQYELDAKRRAECGDTSRELGQRVPFADMEAA